MKLPRLLCAPQQGYSGGRRIPNFVLTLMDAAQEKAALNYRYEHCREFGRRDRVGDLTFTLRIL